MGSVVVGQWRTRVPCKQTGLGIGELQFYWLCGHGTVAKPLCAPDPAPAKRGGSIGSLRAVTVYGEIRPQRGTGYSRCDSISTGCWECNLAVVTIMQVRVGQEEEETGRFKPAQARDLRKVTAGVKQEFLVSLSFWVYRTQRWRDDGGNVAQEEEKGPEPTGEPP